MFIDNNSRNPWPTAATSLHRSHDYGTPFKRLIGSSVPQAEWAAINFDYVVFYDA